MILSSALSQLLRSKEASRFSVRWLVLGSWYWCWVCWPDKSKEKHAAAEG